MFDASVIVDALVSPTADGRHARDALRSANRIEAPAILRAEVASALRRMWLAGELADARARAALSQTSALWVDEYPFEPFQARVWDLRHVMTVYDAWYVAVAEEIGTSLVTSDRRLASVPDLRCPVEALGSSGS